MIIKKTSSEMESCHGLEEREAQYKMRIYHLGEDMTEDKPKLSKHYDGSKEKSSPAGQTHFRSQPSYETVVQL